MATMDVRQRQKIERLAKNAEISIGLTFSEGERGRMVGLAAGLREALDVIDGKYRDILCKALDHGHDYC